MGYVKLRLIHVCFVISLHSLLYSVTHANSTEYLKYVSSIRTDKFTSSSANITTITVASVYEYTNHPKESWTIWKIAAVVLAGSLGLCILIIVGLVINTVRLRRELDMKIDAENTEKIDNYVGLQRADKDLSEDAIYTDLVQINATYCMKTSDC